MDYAIRWSPEAVEDIEEIAAYIRFVYSYRLIYRVEEASVLIVAVIHGKRLLENIERWRDIDPQ
jgi:plasmid stabilization system protein ParE